MMQELLEKFKSRLSKSLQNLNLDDKLQAWVQLNVPSEFKDSYKETVLPENFPNRFEWRKALTLGISNHFKDWRHLVIKKAHEAGLDVGSFYLSGNLFKAYGTLGNLLSFMEEIEVISVTDLGELERTPNFSVLCENKKEAEELT